MKIAEANEAAEAYFTAEELDEIATMVRGVRMYGCSEGTIIKCLAGGVRVIMARREVLESKALADAAPPPCDCPGCDKPSNPERKTLLRCDWCMTYCRIGSGVHTPEPARRRQRSETCAVCGVGPDEPCESAPDTIAVDYHTVPS